MIEFTKLQVIMDHIPVYIFWKDRNSVYKGCNKIFAKSAGLSGPPEIIGKTDFDLPWTEKEAIFFRKIDKEVMDSGEQQINIEEPQTVDGEIRWLLTNKIPLFNNNEMVIGCLLYTSPSPRDRG